MKQIHFHNLEKNKSWTILLLVMVIILMFLGYYPLGIAHNTQEYIRISVFLALIYHNSRIFWYKNNIQWNRKGAIIRIKTFFGKSINFNDIKSVSLNGKILTITKKRQREIRYDLNEYAHADVQKLHKIIAENI